MDESEGARRLRSLYAFTAKSASVKVVGMGLRLSTDIAALVVPCSSVFSITYIRYNLCGRVVDVNRTNVFSYNALRCRFVLGKSWLNNSGIIVLFRGKNFCTCCGGGSMPTYAPSLV